jgi:hypothetical protein
MTVTQIKDSDYIPVDEARQQLGLGYKDMALLLEAQALRFRRGPSDQTIQSVLAQDVRDAITHLARYREEERQRLHSLFPTTARDMQQESETDEGSLFTFSASDLGTLLMALVSYFDAERDVYLGLSDDRGDIGKPVTVVSRIYTWLERDSQAGRPLSETVAEIYEQSPDEKARGEVFLYLMAEVWTHLIKERVVTSQ